MGRCCRSGPGREKEPLARLPKVKMGLETAGLSRLERLFGHLGFGLTSTKGRQKAGAFAEARKTRRGRKERDRGKPTERMRMRG